MSQLRLTHNHDWVASFSTIDDDFLESEMIGACLEDGRGDSIKQIRKLITIADESVWMACIPSGVSVRNTDDYVVPLCVG
jgi:hypothetical protein